MEPYHHIPVLLGEVLEYLHPVSGQNFVDATLGGGGYSRALLEAVLPAGKVLSIDLDAVAIENFKSQIADKEYAANVQVAHGNFRDLDSIVERHSFGNIHGIVADIGLSSFELDQAGRGISFQKHELLDMRFDAQSNIETAEFLVNNLSEQELVTIITKYGEDPFARLIVRGIMRRRAESPIRYTTELVETITQSVPARFRYKAKDNIRRVFQALRIAVNHELDNLEEFLPKALELVNPGGRVAVITFHSLEDRIVKRFFEKASIGCVCPPEFPQCICGNTPAAKIITRKPITASNQELESNPRSKPGKLRVIEKIK